MNHRTNMCMHYRECSSSGKELVFMYRLEQVELTGKAVAAVTRFSRDEGHAVRLASARATGHMALAELRGQLPQDAALSPLLPVMVALIGTDQSSEVQRQMLLVGGLSLQYLPINENVFAVGWTHCCASKS